MPSSTPCRSVSPQREECSSLTNRASYFGGEFSVDMLAVHPSYWRRGHGTSLLSWAARIADEDRIVLGKAAVENGKRISHRLGFDWKEKIEVPSYDEHQDTFTVWIGVRQPQAQG